MSQTVKLVRPTWKNNKTPHCGILKYYSSVLLFRSWFSNRRYKICKMFQHFTGCLSGQSPGSQNCGLNENIIYARYNMTEKGKQQLRKTTTWDKSMRLVLGLFKSAGIVLWIAREASRSCAPKNPREGKPEQIPLWLFSSPCQNRKRQLKKNASALQWYIWECNTKRGTVPLS